MTFIVELIELGQFLVAEATSCQGLSQIVLSQRILCLCVCRTYHSIGTEDNHVIVVPYYLTLIARVGTVIVGQAVTNPVVTVVTADEVFGVTVSEHHDAAVAKVVVATSLSQCIVVGHVDIELREDTAHASFGTLGQSLADSTLLVNSQCCSFGGSVKVFASSKGCRSQSCNKEIFQFHIIILSFILVDT